MRIGEFVTLVNTTKDTVRHYEELGLLKPGWNHSRKEYGEKEVKDYHVILEFKSIGLNLKDIQLIFRLKESLGCGDMNLVREVSKLLSNHLIDLNKEEERLKTRKFMLTETLKELNEYINSSKR